MALQVPIHLLDEFDLAALQVAGESLVCEISDIGILDGTAEGPDCGALIQGRQERTAVVLGSSNAGRWRETDEAGQICVLGSQPVEDPRAHGGANELEAASMQLHESLGMCGNIAIHSVEEAEFVRMACQVREQFRDRESAFAMLTELPGALQEFAVLDFLALVPGQLWLVIEGVDVGGATPHAGKNHALGLAGKVGLAWSEGVAGRGRSCSGLGGEARKRHVSEAG